MPISLSRLDVVTLATDVDIDKLEAEQEKDNELGELIENSSRSSLTLEAGQNGIHRHIKTCISPSMFPTRGLSNSIWTLQDSFTLS